MIRNVLANDRPIDYISGRIDWAGLETQTDSRHDGSMITFSILQFRLYRSHERKHAGRVICIITFHMFRIR